MNNDQINTGFIAGTLVHTDKGLKAIQDIKVGDHVLSSQKQGDGSVREYKRVVNTLAIEEQEIYEIALRKRLYPEKGEVDGDMAHDIYEFIYTTGNQPIYVSGSYFIEDWDNENDEDQIIARSNTWQPAKELRLYDSVLLSDPQYGESKEYEVMYMLPV